MIAKLIKQLEREIGRLPATADRKIARRNARQRVLGTLRKIRTAVDMEWPAIVERAGRKRLTPEGRKLRAKRNGLTMVSVERAGHFAAAGVRLRTINGHLWIPQWAEDIRLTQPSKLAAAVKDRRLRAALLAEIALLA